MGLHEWYDQKKAKYQAWKKKFVQETAEQDELTQVLGSDWNELGYHRAIAGVLYNIALMIPAALMGLLVIPLLQFTPMRDLLISAIPAIAGSLMGIAYNIIDMNMDQVVDKFVPQYMITDPKKAMQYATFYIKYRMWGGLIQIISVPVLVECFIVTQTNFAYLAWYLFWQSLNRYPNTLGFMQKLIQDIQHFHHDNLITFLNSDISQPVVQVIGGVVGLYWGQANPIFGEVYGMIFGMAISGTLCSFVFFVLGSYWLSKALDSYGIRLRDLYAQKVPKEVWKSSLNYAARFMPNTVFSNVIGFTGFMITVSALPGYAVLSSITSMASNLGRFAGWSGQFIGKSQPAYSEAYNNGKLDLVRYYISEGWRYWGLFWFYMAMLNILAVPLIIEIVINIGKVDPEYMIMGPMIVLYVLLSAWSPFNDVADKMLNISKHPEVNSAINIIGTCMNLFFTWYLLAVLHMGWLGLILIGVPSSLFGFVAKFTYMHLKILPLNTRFWKDIAWRVFGAPALAAFIFVLYALVFTQGVWPAISQGQSGILLLLCVGVTLIGLFAGLLILYLPLHAYFGGW
ncbi:MAG TPA: hypothetical protein VKK79_25895, partial [Candidatus Lokiarchaeia archaeon]|nr:hypothetical protein [Candidatus Lokiarchaeia archaeon]